MLDGRGTGRGVRKDSHVNVVGKSRVEVALVASFGAVREAAVETDVVCFTVHPSVPRREGDRGLLLALEGNGRSGVHDVRLAAVSHVRDFHVKHVIAGKHTVGGLDVPRVRQSTVDGQNTSQALVVVAGEDVGLSNGDVNRFNVEDHALDVVGLRQFVVVVPRLADGGVVKRGLYVQTIDTREELVARDNGGSGFFCIDVGSGIGVNSVLDEGVFLQGDVVETNALEAVIDAVAAVIVRLEIKVDINHGALKRHALRSPLAGVRRRAVLNVQVGQVNARGLDEFIGIEEHVVVATAVGVGRIADEGQLGLVN